MQKRPDRLPPLDLLAAFEAAARHLSFTRAWAERFVTQSAMSRQIRALEDELGVALFKRKPEPVAGLEENRRESGAAADGAAKSAAPSAKEKSLGTGHGHNEMSPARYVAFERESDTPTEVIAIHYDTYANLVARGVIPSSPRWPSPFPGGFVPDPPARG